MTPLRASWLALLGLATLAIPAPFAARAGADDGPRGRPASLGSLESRLKELMGRICPGAAVSRQEDALVARDRTQVFQVHDAFKDGEFSPESHPERGPKARGFQLRLSLQDGPYRGQADLPQDLRGPYWTTFLEAHELDGGRRHLLMSLEYGSRTDPKVIGQIKDAVAAWAADLSREEAPR